MLRACSLWHTVNLWYLSSVVNVRLDLAFHFERYWLKLMPQQLLLSMRRRAGSCGGGRFFRHSTSLNGLTTQLCLNDEFCPVGGIVLPITVGLSVHFRSLGSLWLDRAMLLLDTECDGPVILGKRFWWVYIKWVWKNPTVTSGQQIHKCLLLFFLRLEEHCNAHAMKVVEW